MPPARTRPSISSRSWRGSTRRSSSILDSPRKRGPRATAPSLPLDARFRGGFSNEWKEYCPAIAASAGWAGRREVILGGPLGEVAALDGGGHEGGEPVGRAGEARHAEGGERGGVVVVEGRRALVVEGEQADDHDAGIGEALGALQHLRAAAALEEVGDEHEDRRIRPLDDLLAIGERAVDVGAAAELRAEEEVDRILQVVGEVDDGGVEDDHARAERPHR